MYITRKILDANYDILASRPWSGAVLLVYYPFLSKSPKGVFFSPRYVVCGGEDRKMSDIPPHIRDQNPVSVTEKPKKTTAFYAEMVSITILSLVAASMWIELTKGTMSRTFDNNPWVLFLAAIAATLIAIFGLKYMFCDNSHAGH